jgi:DNA-binding MarR family transcriptional regulator
LRKYETQLYSYWDLLFPHELESDEYVRVVGLLNEYRHTWFIKSVEELISIVSRNRHCYNLYITLASTKGKAGKEENMYRRSVVMLDFDKKDIVNLENWKCAIQMIKEKYPSLYYHSVIDTGHGYHVYFGNETSKDIREIKELNLLLAQNIGSDSAACSVTQIARLPGSLNLKNKENIKFVTSLCNEVYSPKFKRYKLQRLSMILGNFEPPPNITPLQYDKALKYLCCQRMIQEGSKKGDRNICLCRIVKYYQDIIGLTKEQALKNILDWNKKCYPPKPESEIIRDFNTNWDTKYNYLGCKAKNNPRVQRVIDEYCDPHECKTMLNGQDKTIDDVSTEIYRLDNKYWSVQNMERLKGYDYFILGILNFYEEGLSTNDLKDKLTNRKTKKLAISEPTLYGVLKNLEKYGYVECVRGKPNFYRIVTTANYNRGYTRMAYQTGLLLINEIITQKEYLVYLYLTMSIQKVKPMTYEDMARDLRIDVGNISKYIAELTKMGIIKVIKDYIPSKGTYYNRYILTC